VPSNYGETWGLAVNEALACGRPVVVSDRVGCAADVVDPTCGRVFPSNDWSAFGNIVDELIKEPHKLPQMARAVAERARAFDIGGSEAALVSAIEKVCAP